MVKIYPDSKPVDFETFKNQAGLNSHKISSRVMLNNFQAQRQRVPAKFSCSKISNNCHKRQAFANFLPPDTRPLINLIAPAIVIMTFDFKTFDLFYDLRPLL